VVKLRLEKEAEDQGFEVRKPWLPVAMQVLTKDIAEGLVRSGLTGMRITQVYPNSSAEKAGLKVGDLIMGLDEETINASLPEDYEILPAMLRQYRIGSTVELAVLRGGEKLNIQVELERSPRSLNEMKKYIDNIFEFTVREVAFLDYAREGWEDSPGGVLVESVSEGGWASIAKLSVGDFILALDNEPVNDLVSFERAMKDIVEEQPRSVVFQVRRGIHTHYIELQPSWELDD
jgi:S1-C subfamily serine protease